MAIFDRDAMVLIESSRAAGPILVNRLPGYRAPMLATSLGLAYLAFAAVEEREDVLRRVAEQPQSWNEIAHNREQTEKLFREIRSQGYATMHEEYSRTEYGRQISTVGVPILNNAGVSVAAMNVLYLKSALSPGRSDQDHGAAASGMRDRDRGSTGCRSGVMINQIVPSGKPDQPAFGTAFIQSKNICCA